jgi:hypothetical protein
VTIAISLVLLVVGFLAALRAATASSTERLLWGSLALSICLGLAVELRGEGYYGIEMVAVFMVTDLMLYLFFRSLKLLPGRPARHAQGDRAYRVFFFWLALCAVVGVVLLAFAPVSEGVWSSPAASEIGLLYARIWSGDWLLVALPVLGLVILVTGGFFLVRRES